MRLWRTSLRLLAFASVMFACAAASKSAAGKAFLGNATGAEPAANETAQGSARPQSTLQLAPLPLWSRDRPAPASLLPMIPDGRTLLMARVQEKFASGEQNFKAGHLDAARRDFNDAVDWMLESGYDPNGEPRLSELFRHVVDFVYTYELQAFRAGDGFQETPAVPAPIDEVAEMTFPVDPRLKDRAEQAAKTTSHDLPLTVNDEVLSFLNFFQTPRGKAIVETGLRRSWWVDERQDPEKATRAAAQHLRDLYGLFGDWYLAMAAYNCGPGNVQKGVERTGYADFWELYRRNVLPRE